MRSLFRNFFKKKKKKFVILFFTPKKSRTFAPKLENTVSFMKNINAFIFAFAALFAVTFTANNAFAQNTPLEHANPCEEKGEHKVDYTETMLHHIGNSNELEVIPGGIFTLPLPVITYSEDAGFSFAMSSAFHDGEEGHIAHNGYILNHGVINRIKGSFPTEDTKVELAHTHEGKAVVCHNGQTYELEGSKNMLEESSFYDFSISKNVFTMILGILLMAFIFIRLANYYKNNS